MGNQNSRLERRLGSTASQDPRLTTVNEWLPSAQDPYQRHYPLPIVSPSRTNSGRIKLRKQSTPLIPSTAYTTTRRRPLSRVFTFRPFNKTTNTTNNTTLSPSLHRSSTVLPDTSLHPLLLSNQQRHSFYCTPTSPTTTTPSPFSTNTTTTATVTPCSSYHTLSQQNNSIQVQSDRLIHSNEVIWMNGRKFHACPGSSYILPCDEEEIDRLHLLHFMVRFAIQGNYLAPVTDILRKGAHVLDIGCGPGSWTMEIAGEYPKSTIVGVDMTSMFPQDIKPTNCQFYQCNVLQGLPFQEATFDYVFMRFMGQGIELEQWDVLLKDIIRVLKPGGWVELVEMDLELHRAGPITKTYNGYLMSLMTTRQLDPHSGRRLKERFDQREELINVNSTFISCPGGQWAGKLGQLTMQSWKSYYQAIQPQICMSSSDLTAEEYKEKLATCWDEADEYKTFENVHFAYAQKRPSSTQ
ncbi:S-adenosyl-L-methionine-dependent methyltransferase [Chlamydoabsidia padenii]|nr:S-adenosyl-L-methionine-dependent methyltransferase [Chlamydoabsidia padenii]